jgi:hypothetical protein
MKHHFADMLDRDGGYWTITPNDERWRCHFDDLDDAPADTSRLTLTRDAQGTKEQVEARCRAHEEKYRQLVEKFRQQNQQKVNP